jgi:hypothetical protein
LSEFAETHKKASFTECKLYINLIKTIDLLIPLLMFFGENLRFHYVFQLQNEILNRAFWWKKFNLYENGLKILFLLLFLI